MQSRTVRVIIHGRDIILHLCFTFTAYGEKLTSSTHPLLSYEIYPWERKQRDKVESN